MIVLALDAITMGVLAANSMVMARSGAPAETRRLESSGKRNASPGSRRESAAQERSAAAARNWGVGSLLLPYDRTR